MTRGSQNVGQRWGWKVYNLLRCSEKLGNHSLRHVKILLLLAGAMVTATPLAALCQTPIKGPIRILVAVGPGSISDVEARVLAEKLTGSLGQPVIVENKPGATGGIAAVAFKKMVCALQMLAMKQNRVFSIKNFRTRKEPDRIPDAVSDYRCRHQKSIQQEKIQIAL